MRLAGRRTLASLADVAPGLRRELAARVRRAPDRLGDLGERQSEHVVQHERDPLRRTERLEHDQQRRAHGVVERDLLQRVGGDGCREGRGPRQRFGQPLPHVAFPPRPRGAEHVEADATRHTHEPRSGIVDRCALGVAQSVPARVRLLYGVLGIGHCAEHPISQPHQLAALVLEGLDGLGHGASFRLLHCTTTQCSEM